MDARLVDHQADQEALLTLLRDLNQELRHPLASLRAEFDLLLDDAPGPIQPEHQGHVTTITGLCDELLGLTRGYLDYIEAARPSGPSQPRRLTLGAIVAELRQEFAPIASDQGLSFETVVEASDTEVVADPERCMRIFENLIANAIAYTPRGGRVRVETRLDGDSWVLTVEDNGPGIPAESQARVFEPFYRLKREENSSIPGDGLGLAICRALTTHLRGEIHLWTEANRGTRFTVVLPRVSEESA